MRQFVFTFAAILLASFLNGCAIYAPGNGSSSAKEYSADLTGDAERPDPVETDANGSGTFMLNDDDSELSFDVEASGLSGDITAAHFHVSMTGAEGFGEVVFDITQDATNNGDGSASLTGSWMLSEEDLRNLRLGYIYINLHTDENPAGEIRGNLTAVE